MNAIVELLVTGLSGSTAVGSVDLFGDEPIQLNLSIANIKNISQRNTTFTQNFSIPGTPNNNKLFNNIFEIGSNGLFNPAHKTPCQLLVDTVPVVANGVLQLTDISIDDQKNITYMVTIFDDATDILDNIGTLELTDLQFSGLNHTWNTTNITNTWTGSSQPYFYPLIDYGNDFDVPALNGSYNSGLGVTVNEMVPAIQTKRVLDAIFSAAGYTYSSNFFNSDYFKNLYLPFNGSVDNIAQSLTVINQNSFNAVLPTDTATSVVPLQASNNGVHYNTPAIQYPYSNDSVFPGFNGGGYNNSFFTFTPNVTLCAQFNLNLYWTYSHTGGGFTNLQLAQAVAVFYRNGGTYTANGGQFYTYASPPQNIVSQFGQVQNNLFQTPPLNGAPGTQYGAAEVGEKFSVQVFFMGQYLAAAGAGNLVFTINAGTSFYDTVYPTMVPNTTIDMNNMVPKKVKQIDLFNSIITMHNLYVIPNKLNPKNLIIEPRDDYNATGVLRDWSNKLDLSQTVTESLLSEQQNKRIIFTYKLDSDFFNTDYNTITKKIFGDEYVVIDNDFTKDDKTITTIFSPTPSVAVLDSSFVPPSVGQFSVGTVNDFVIPKIGKVDNSSGAFSSTDCNIRILQKFSGNTVELSGSESWKLNGTTYTAYPYLGMLNHPFSGDTDIAFGTVDYEYYALSAITNNGLVNKYYRTYLDQIIDKDSKLITCQLYLTPADIQQFNFCDTIFIDSLASNGMGGYFLVNSIKYTPTTNTTSEVELILVKEVVSSGIFYPAINHRIKPPLNVITLGGGKTFSTNSIAIGNGVLIGNGSVGSLAIGNNLNIAGGSTYNLLMGSGSTISAGVNNSLSIGNGNSINNGSSNSLIFGNNVIVGINSSSGVTGTTLTGVTVFGSNITANTANTVYVNNLTISSGGTINNIVISAITAGAGLWTSGTSGHQSVQALNDSGLFASNDYAYAEGNNTKASGITSHAEGSNTTAGGTGSHSEGETTAALGIDSHAEGLVTIALGNYSHAEGYGTTAGGIGSHSEGQGTYAGDNSHAEGLQTTAVFGSHAEGFNTSAGNSFGTPQTYSHSEGISTMATGLGAHAEGNNSVAPANYGHAGGLNAAAQNTGEWARSSGGGATGDQYGTVNMYVDTVNNTPTQAFIGATGSEKFILATGAVRYCRVYVIVVDHSTQDAKQFKGEGIIRCIAGSTSLVGTFTMTSTNASASLTAASVAVTAGGGTQDLVVTVTGVSANLGWFIRIDYEQVF